MRDSAAQPITALAPPGTWARLLRESGGVPPRYWGRLARIVAATSLATPLRLLETLRYGRRVAQTEIAEPPIFILGFARSGTTHLHNLFARSPRYGVVTTFQAIAPTLYLVGRGALKRRIAKFMPSRRPMDAMAVSLDLPQEEEIAIANSCHLSAVHLLVFPQRMPVASRKFNLMQGLTDRERARWERVYLDILRKATFASGGRRLVLKSPTNTGRVAHLLRLFPDAKFVHLVRNPYVVYHSVLHLMRVVVPAQQLQAADMAAIAADVNETYVAVTRRYLRDRSLIPEGNLAEVRFEDLERRPLGEMRRIYEELGLPGWDEDEPRVSEYLEGLAGYRKNRFSMDEPTRERIARDWRLAFDAWGYAPEARPPELSG